jgi:hypothetical protein
MAADSIPADAFGVLLSGEVVVTLTDRAADGASELAAARLAVEATGGTGDAVAAAPEVSLAVCRLRVGSTLGETGTLLGTPRADAHATAQGAELLCWRREAAVEEVLAQSSHPIGPHPHTPHGTPP